MRLAISPLHSAMSWLNKEKIPKRGKQEKEQNVIEICPTGDLVPKEVQKGEGRKRNMRDGQRNLRWVKKRSMHPSKDFISTVTDTTL